MMMFNILFLNLDKRDFQELCLWDQVHGHSVAKARGK